MTPLVRKELRDQRPFLLLALFFFALEVLDDVIWVDPVKQTLATTIKVLRTGEDADLFTAILAFALGAGILVREQDDRTLEFLEGLPVTRPRIFGVKVAVALGVALIFPALYVLYTLLCNALAATSLDRSLHLELLGPALGLRVAQAFVLLSLSLALSHFRRLIWLLLGSLFTAFTLARERIPRLELLNPFALASPHFEGRHWRIPWNMLGVQLLVAAVLLGVSLALFTGAGERLVAKIESRMRGVVVGGLVTLATIGTCLYALFHVMDNLGDPDSPQKGKGPAVSFSQAPPGHAQTARYRFTYPSSQTGRAGRLVERADATFETVRAFLGGEAGEPIAVDLSGSARHTAGTAYWSTVRMAIQPDETPEESQSTLGHETTHVLAQRRAGIEAERIYGQFATFNEGLATFVENRFFQPHTPRAAQELIAAAMWARREVKLEEVVDATLLAKRRGLELVYPYGLLFVDALVKRYGDGAPAKLLAAMGRKDAPTGLDAIARWQDTFQAAGFDLPEVAEDFQAELDRLAKAHAAELAALPRPRGAVEADEDEDEVVVRPLLDTKPPPGWTVVCRFRLFENSAREEIDGPYDASKGCSRERSRIAHNELSYQLGLENPYGVALYEPWTSAPVE